MTQQLIIDALRARTEVGPVRCYYGDWIVVYEGREIARWDHHLNVLVVRRCTRPDRIKESNQKMTFEEAKQQAIERSEWVLCHGAGYYTARTPDGRDIIGKGENGVFVGGEYRRVVVRVHKATESIEVYFGMERNGLISALEVGGDHFEAGLEYYRRETRPATEAEEKEAVKYLRARNYTHFKLSKRCALKR
jgi:hypothetical protein